MRDGTGTDQATAAALVFHGHSAERGTHTLRPIARDRIDNAGAASAAADKHIHSRRFMAHPPHFLAAAPVWSQGVRLNASPRHLPVSTGSRRARRMRHLILTFRRQSPHQRTGKQGSWAWHRIAGDEVLRGRTEHALPWW